MTSFAFKTWCSDHGLKEKTIDKLGKKSQEALKLVHADRHCHVGLYPWTEETPATRYSRTNSAEKIPKAGETKPIETTAVTTEKLARDGGLEELLKKDRRSFIK